MYVFLCNVSLFSHIPHLDLKAFFKLHARGRSPAGVSLAAAGVDALGQGVVQGGIDHVETDRLLVHLAARVPAQHTQHRTSEHFGYVLSFRPQN